MIAILLVVISVVGVGVFAASDKPLAACPGKIISVDLEADAGKYNPPALLVPDWDNGKDGIHLYSEWNNIKEENLVVHCYMEPSGQEKPNTPIKVIDIKVPKEVNKCMRFRNEFSCFVAPLKSGTK